MTPAIAAFMKQASILGLTCSAVGVTTYKSHEPIKNQIQKFSGHKKTVNKIKRKVHRKHTTIPPCPMMINSFPIQVPVRDLWMNGFTMPAVDSSGNYNQNYVPVVLRHNQYFGGSSGSSSGGGSSGSSSSGGGSSGSSSSGGTSSTSSGGSSGGNPVPPLPLPETGTWLMMLSGFAVTGVVVRFKMKKKISNSRKIDV